MRVVWYLAISWLTSTQTLCASGQKISLHDQWFCSPRIYKDCDRTRGFSCLAIVMCLQGRSKILGRATNLKGIERWKQLWSEGDNTGLFKMTARVLTTCYTQYTWDSSICIFLFNRTTLQVFVSYLTGALYVHPLWFYKHQHDNRVCSTQNAFSLPFAAILVNCAPSGEMHNYCTPHNIKENYENFLIHRCNYILLSQVYCVWQAVKTPTIILNNPV